jgi:hypothetical protein
LALKIIWLCLHTWVYLEKWSWILVEETEFVLCNLFLRNHWAFPFSELGRISYCLITVAVSHSSSLLSNAATWLFHS